MSETYSQNPNINNFGEPDVYGMEYDAFILSGDEISNCCEDLVIEFGFLPDENISGPQSAYAEVQFFGDPDDLIYDEDIVSIEPIPNDVRYKVVIDTEFPDFSELPNDESTWKVTITQVRSDYINTVENRVSFRFYYGFDDNGVLNGSPIWISGAPWDQKTFS